MWSASVNFSLYLYRPYSGEIPRYRNPLDNDDDDDDDADDLPDQVLWV